MIRAARIRSLMSVCQSASCTCSLLAISWATKLSVAVQRATTNNIHIRIYIYIYICTMLQLSWDRERENHARVFIVELFMSFNEDRTSKLDYILLWQFSIVVADRFILYTIINTLHLQYILGISLLIWLVSI